MFTSLNQCWPLRWTREAHDQSTNNITGELDKWTSGQLAAGQLTMVMTRAVGHRSGRPLVNGPLTRACTGSWSFKQDVNFAMSFLYTIHTLTCRRCWGTISAAYPRVRVFLVFLIQTHPSIDCWTCLVWVQTRFCCPTNTQYKTSTSDLRVRWLMLCLAFNRSLKANIGRYQS